MFVEPVRDVWDILIKREHSTRVKRFHQGLHMPAYCLMSSASRLNGCSFRCTHTFSGNPKVAALQLVEDVEELFEETHDLSSKLVVIGDIWNALGKSGL